MERIVSFRLPEEEVSIIENLVELGFFRNKTDFFSFAVHRAITDYVIGVEKLYTLIEQGEFAKYMIDDKEVDRQEFIRAVNKRFGLDGVKVVEQSEVYAKELILTAKGIVFRFGDDSDGGEM